jgi:transcriptional regulator with XRE-family HTH domain
LSTALWQSLAVTGSKLTRIRESLGLTKKEFARRLGISRTLLQKSEESPRVKTTVALAAKALAAGLDPK